MVTPVHGTLTFPGDRRITSAELPSQDKAFDRKTGKLLGAQLVGQEGAAHRINAAAVALHNRMSVRAFSETDLSYAPPFGPTWDPLLVAANQLLKKV